MPEQVTTTATSLWHGVVAGFTSLMEFIPALIGGLIILVLGWLVAKAVGRIVERLLHAMKLEHAFTRSQLAGFLPPRTPPITISAVVGTLAKWFVFLIFVQAAANVLRMPQITQIINNILMFIPNVFVALLILVLGSVLARFLSGLVEGSITRMNVSNPRIFGAITRYAIIGFATIAAVNQIGVATNLISILFTGLVGSIALAFGLAFGLGGQNVASEITRGWYDRTISGTRLRSVPGTEESGKSLKK